MASPKSDGAGAENPMSASLRDEVLQELVDIACNIANAQIDGLTTRLSDAMLDVAHKSTDPKEAKLHANSASLLKKNRYPFFYVASERMATALHHEIQATEYPLTTLGDTSGALHTLDPELEVDKKLTLIKTARAIEAEHATRLAALNIRLASLLGKEALEAGENPFRPHIFLTVLHDAWCEFQPDVSAHHIVYRLLSPELSLDMAAILHALNTALIKRGIVPHIAARDLPASSAARTEAEEGDADPLTKKLRTLFPPEAPVAEAHEAASSPGGFPALFLEETVQATASRNILLSYLSALQRNMTEPPPSAGAANAPRYTPLLVQIRDNAPPGALAGADDSVLDLLTKIFDAILGDKHVPADLKAIIAQLQLPVLKLALSDKSFFFMEHHPARRALELLARLSIGWDPLKGATDPIYLLVQRGVRQIVQESDRNPGVFADVVADLDAFMRRDETASTQALSAPIAGALKQEKLLEATKAAKNEVALRVGTGEVVAFVETFLEDKWVSVLTLAYTVKDEKPQAVDSAIRTMDDLCWSVKPKITMLERKELLAKLPGMIAMLNKWLDAIKWNDKEREKFFSDLATCHASIVRAPLELSPERQMQIALAVAKKAAERRRERQARMQPEPEPDEFVHLVGTLECGTWVEFAQLDGSTTKVKLAWISPMRSLYIFATRERKEAMSLSAEVLAQTFRDKRARVVSQPGLIGRVLASALGVESANAATMLAASAA
ncbi:MAG TPA: DUF1631 family protein [Noviherbaspirillum sp.]